MNSSFLTIPTGSQDTLSIIRPALSVLLFFDIISVNESIGIRHWILLSFILTSFSMF